MRDNDSIDKSFPSNSKKDRDRSKVSRKRIKKVISGSVKKQKKGFLRKIADVFIEDDPRSVGTYIFHDVLIPAAKSMISDMISGGVDMLLFDGKRGSRTRREGGRSFTSYGSYYNTSDRSRDRDRGRDMSRQGRARHDFDEIILENRGEAEEVLSHLVDLTIDYEMATVADLYDLVGITSNFTDAKYGWTDLHAASVDRVRNGYVINLPRTQLLE